VKKHFLSVKKHFLSVKKTLFISEKTLLKITVFFKSVFIPLPY
jgi:hypothetical protein